MTTTTQNVTIYWRPGCPYCENLRSGLGADASKAEWVNIWLDSAAAKKVASVNNGNEVVPTVFVGDISLTNPAPAEVKALINA